MHASYQTRVDRSEVLKVRRSAVCTAPCCISWGGRPFYTRHCKPHDLINIEQCFWSRNVRRACVSNRAIESISSNISQLEKNTNLGSCFSCCSAFVLFLTLRLSRNLYSVTVLSQTICRDLLPASSQSRHSTMSHGCYVVRHLTAHGCDITERDWILIHSRVESGSRSQGEAWGECRGVEQKVQHVICVVCTQAGTRFT